MTRRIGFAGRVTRVFIDNPVTPILMVIAALAGIAATSLVPREEEPQIRVPVVDIIIPAPGLDARDVLEIVTRPIEDIVAGVEGVDHVYSRTRGGRAIVSARFFTGTDSDDAALRIIERIGANGERRPPGVAEPIIVGRGIEDVAIVTFTLSPAVQARGRYDHGAIWNLAEELRWRMTAIDRVGVTTVVGTGAPELRVEQIGRASCRERV
jgi:multidrug efflux pump subunit AcrB